MKPFVMITGVSSGIGLDCARLLLRRGYRVIGTLRSEADARRLSGELGDDFLPLLLDVSKAQDLPAALRQVEGWVGQQGLAALVNNAGIASPCGPLLLQPLAEIRGLFEVNLFGLLAVIQAFAPLLGAYAGSERAGRLINLGSMSGRVATPLTGSYAASKHALEAVSDVLRVELAIYGIDVVLIEPGPIRTAIWDKAPDYHCYQGTDYQAGMAALGTMMAANAERGAAPALVSQAILRAIEAPRPKARYPLHPLWHLARWLPTRLLDRLMARRVGLSARRPSA
ncbi:SDR family oxidoreductase [Aquipseudomonas campi]|uniref:SDR family oxidoreductase n=1 Tax=Aquipseudomonas campi TaxID=2731681 RepID=A0A6M8F894_9GAMM|nr:SDR family oxidoreductase [Pseudomonas campi]QKE63521.1 SDR family oxidoreductase [Pseudomonas campi]